MSPAPPAPLRREGQVLVLSGRFDPTADLVVEELNRRAVPVFRADLAEFPLELSLAASFDGTATGSLRNDRRELDLAAVRSVYYRRPTRPRFPAGMSPPARRVAEREARLGFGGLLAALPCRWLPPPGRAAAECGLKAPRTLITNDPAAAKEFAAGVAGPVPYKPFSPVRGVVGGASVAVYASVVDPAAPADPAIAGTAHLFQAAAPKRRTSAVLRSLPVESSLRRSGPHQSGGSPLIRQRLWRTRQRGGGYVDTAHARIGG
ncbi:MvdC/MvdD family ATP grasp protein [Embleya sp. NPDC059259]|uniref:MvdC/MvdD family ATP grasp protein n=1 Tax=unclassified Embleya TaxID=2699296 RepID=UPI003681F93C